MTKFHGFNRAWSVKVSYRGPIATDGNGVPTNYGTYWRGGYPYEYGMNVPRYPVPATQGQWIAQSNSGDLYYSTNGLFEYLPPNV